MIQMRAVAVIWGHLLVIRFVACGDCGDENTKLSVDICAATVTHH